MQGGLYRRRKVASTAWLYERKPLYSTVSRVLAFSGWQDKGSVAKNSSRELAHRDQFVTIRTQQPSPDCTNRNGGSLEGSYCREINATCCGLTIPVTTGSAHRFELRRTDEASTVAGEYGEPARKAFSRVFISATKFQ